MQFSVQFGKHLLYLILDKGNAVCTLLNNDQNPLLRLQCWLIICNITYTGPIQLVIKGLTALAQIISNIANKKYDLFNSPSLYVGICGLGTLLVFDLKCNIESSN